MRNGADHRAGRSDLLRHIPSVDQILNRPATAKLIKSAGRTLTTSAIREVLADFRVQARKGTAPITYDEAQLHSAISRKLDERIAPSLRPVINATGVILHTNLGRAPLSKESAARIAATATRYSNLEYDIFAGKRGKRDVHTSRALAEVCGAEAAIVVNNNAAAVFLVLNTLAKGGEVLVSRGELIEIGDGFRIPEIMAESGAFLREVGATNRTRIADYHRAITRETRLLLGSIPRTSKSSASPIAPRWMNLYLWAARSACLFSKTWVPVACLISPARELPSLWCARALPPALTL